MIPEEQLVSTRSSRSWGAVPGWAAATFLLAGAGLLSTTGCEEEPLRLRVRVNAPRVTSEVNAVKVWFAGSRGPCSDPDTCIPVFRIYRLTRPSELPFYVDYLPGPEFRDCVYVRVEYLYDNGLAPPVPKALRGGAQAMPESGTVELPLEMDEQSLSSSCNPATEQYTDGICQVLRPPGLFDDPPAFAAPGALPCAVRYDGVGVED